MNIIELAKQITPLIAQKLLTTVSVSGNPERIKIAPKVGPNNTIFNVNSGDITIEEDVCFGHNVCILTGTHDIRKKGRARITEFPKTGRDVIVRKGAWLSSNVTILGPCEVGENAVIAAGSLVIGDVKANCVYAGSPAKFIKEIEFDDE